ncbi:MAG: PAS domain-containing sensor histidine kinase [Desulfovibrionales bacterium]|nr:MAG: PAS domain-containing sensor histidine kinase [Desulfovibrionales bacterium]
MSDKKNAPRQTPADAADLRKRAEKQAVAMEPISLSGQTPESVRQVLHELRVHQIELTMQNEELRRAQAEIEAERARYFDLYDLAPVGYVTVSEKGLILEANLTVATLLGVNRGVLVKQPLSLFILKEDQDIYYLHRKKLFETGVPQEWELRLKKLDGSLFFASLEGAFAKTNGASTCRIVISDITARKHAELYISRMNEQLQLALAEKDRFFSIIAHDLRSPMIGLVGVSRLLVNNAMDFPTNELHAVAVSMKDAAEKLFTLLENLLEWSSLNRGIIVFDPDEIGLKDVILRSTELLRTVADQKKVVLCCTVPSDVKVFADQRMLDIVLRNLLTNALKFSNPGSSVTIGATRDEATVVIAVQDNGVGMDHCTAAKIFSLDKTTSRIGTKGERGSGIGLILCKEFVEKQGGRIWVESTSGQGSIFKFSLPIKDRSPGPGTILHTDASKRAMMCQPIMNHS